MKMILPSIVQGFRQAIAVPKLLLLLWLSNLLFAVPASLILGQILAESFADSRVATNMLEGFDLGWHAEFESTASSFGETFQPTISGPGPVLEHLEAWWSGELFAGHLGLVALGLSYAVLWAFLLGGVLDRLTVPSDAYSLEQFSRAGGRLLPRFIGLAVISGIAYWGIYELARRAYGWLQSANRDLTEERTLLMWVLPIAIATVGLLIIVRTFFDYAKIALAVDNNTSLLGSLVAALRCVRRFPFAVLAVAFVMAGFSAALLGLYAWLAPGVGQSTGVMIVLAFLGSQLYFVGRIWLRVALIGSEMRLFQAMH